MADTTLTKIARHLQDEYLLRTGKNDLVEWRPLASKLGVTEKEIWAALYEAFTVGKQLELQQVGRDYIQLAPRALLEADRRKKT
jgi:hypothetical protein